MIKRLESDVSTRIAAGEVIERPSSVAKELIENSIDAGSKSVTIFAEQGGKSSFVIEDDGSGIAFDELPLALERYATSKISTIDDLENIATLGYRGEALASVAAVSRMEIRSRTRDAQSGGIITCEGGVINLHTETPCKTGTRIQVDDLFFNLPARRKFLKTASAELRRIIQIVNDYALIHPDMTFRLFSDSKKILEILPSESISDSLELRWGDSTKIFYSEKNNGHVNAKLWWNPIPDGRRVIISLFVNGRRVQDATVRAAVCGGDSTAYGEWLILIDLPPEQLDVNIHPTKEEVRFRKSQEIFKIVYDNAQSIFAKRFSIENSGVVYGDNTPYFEIKCSETAANFERTANLFSSERWAPVYNDGQRTASPIETIFTPAVREEVPSQTVIKNYIGQTARGFLLFDFPDALAVIDPHAAHERILFEEITNSFKDTILTQNMTIPLDIPVGLLPEVNMNINELSSLGFTVTENKLAGVPLVRGKGHLSPIEMLRSALRGMEVERDPAKRDMEVWWRIARLACRDAVKLGQYIGRQEAEELLRRLELCRTPYSCPHGRPTIYILDNKKLEDWFER